MGPLYSKARITVAYIGAPKTTNPHDAFISTFAASGALTLPLVHFRGALEVPELKMDTLFELWLQPWFSRSWVFQEMVLASDIVCLYGDEHEHASWSPNLMMEWMTNVADPDKSSHVWKPTITQPSSTEAKQMSYNQVNIETWRILRNKLRQSPSGLDPIDVLSHGRRADASDSRDKVYSFIGLFRKDDSNALNVDYSKSNTVAKTFIDFAEFCILSGQAIRLLEHAGISQKVPGLPSWVPDWTFEPRYPMHYGNYHCAGSTKSSVSLTKELGKIRARGWTIGIVERLGPACSYPGGALMAPYPPISIDKGTIVLEGFAYEICKMLADSNDCINGEHFSDVIWRTLLMDQNSTGSRCDDGYRRYYECWCAARNVDKRCSRYNSIPGLTSTDPRVRKYATFFEGAASIISGRVLCLISGGLFGMLPNDAVKGDIIAVLQGGRTPFAVRHVAGSEEYQLVGPCYVHGIMDGQFVADAELREPVIR